VVIFGSDLANNQPVTTKYLCYAKRQGTRIVVVNPMREPGLERYWVPSDLRSAVFGTKLMDDFFVRVGDTCLHQRRSESLIEAGQFDRNFIDKHARGFDDLEAAGATNVGNAGAAPGLSQEQMLRFAEQYARAKTAVFVYSMGLTQHRFGVDNVKALVNLALARGMVGREKCGIMAIRGHSGAGRCRMRRRPDRFPAVCCRRRERPASFLAPSRAR
jgi:anaerobic selenocysteine-containing dehydrogenase